MSSPLNWFYLAGDQSQGPFAEEQLVQFFQNGQLDPSTQVAAGGWPQWQSASAVFGPRLQTPQPQSPFMNPNFAIAPAPAPTAVAAVQIRCVSGPDAGRMFVISSAEVTLGRVAGLVDPAVAPHHVVLSWQNNLMDFRAINGPVIVGPHQPQSGALLLGQEFRIGDSVWQVGSQSVTLGSLLESVGARISSLANTERLEGFSLGEMFSETFKKREQDEIDEYFICGTTRTTPPLDQVTTGWPKPWFFMRVLLFFLAIYFAFSIAFLQFENTNLLPGLMMMGSLAVPLATVILFFELNTPRNVPFHYTLVLICLGGIVSIAFALIGFRISNLASWMGAPAAGIVEEIGKILTVLIVVRHRRYKYVLNGLLFGAAVGAGFAVFESAGYAFRRLFEAREVSAMQINILLRAVLSPFGHVAWTAIAAAALWRVKGDRDFSPGMLFRPLFFKAFLIPVLLHMMWNAEIIPSPFWIKHILLGVIGWFVVFGFVQEGMRQVKAAQLAQAREALSTTKSVIAAVTGSHRAFGQ